MTASNDHFNREGILLHCIIECPVCGEKAPSFRTRRVMNLRTVNGEFYHRTATCAGSMTPDLPAAMDLLRLAVGRTCEDNGQAGRARLRSRHRSVAKRPDALDAHALARLGEPVKPR
jgi:hypothetical protein